MRILVMADLSGRRNHGVVETGELSLRPTLSVDIDNFEERMRRLAPALRLPLAEGDGAVLEMAFEDLDSFHPDALYDRLELFQSLRRTRSMLLDPATFSLAAAQLGSAAPEPTAAAPADAPAADEAGGDGEDGEDGDSMMARLLGKAPARPSTAKAPPAAGGVDISNLIKGIVGPHIVPDPDPRQDQMVASVDAALGQQMRKLLHHPDFQALEATWRNVWGLVTGLEVGEELEIHLLDITKEEIAADVRAAAGDLSRAGIHGLLVERGVGSAGGRPWSVLLCDFTFGPDADDVTLLASLGATASRAGGPVLAAAAPTLLGIGSMAGATDPGGWPGLEGPVGDLWESFRQCPAAPWVGLALPRVLVRLPYGARTEELDRFDFEEMESPRDHEAYLWGNPAYSVALLIGKAFTARGWSMQPGDVLDVEDLPAHTFEEDGEPEMQATAEIYLTERGADAVLTRGVIPLMSYRNRNAARVARIQSVASPPRPLAGPW